MKDKLHRVEPEADDSDDGLTPAEVYEEKLEIRENPYFSLNHFDGLDDVKNDLRSKVLKRLCSNCPHKENCFVQQRIHHYAYGFSERRLIVAQRRKRLSDPDEQELLQLRAGAESLVNEVLSFARCRSDTTKR